MCIKVVRIHTNFEASRSAMMYMVLMSTLWCHVNACVVCAGRPGIIQSGRRRLTAFCRFADSNSFIAQLVLQTFVFTC